MAINDEQLVRLLDDSYKKIEATSIQDTAVLNNYNNSLNWILTFTTVFFVFFTRAELNRKILYENLLSILSILLFILMTANLIIHKMLLVEYERTKGAYLASLHTHYIDLKVNLQNLKAQLTNTPKVDTVGFINNFREGNFVYAYNKEEIKGSLQNFDKTISFCGKWLKLTFKFGIVAFWINFLVIILILIN